jgi:hypothetical protein
MIYSTVIGGIFPLKQNSAEAFSLFSCSKKKAEFPTLMFITDEELNALPSEEAKKDAVLNTRMGFFRFCGLIGGDGKLYNQTNRTPLCDALIPPESHQVFLKYLQLIEKTSFCNCNSRLTRCP